MSNSASVLENPIIINQKVVVTVLEPKGDDVGSAVPVSKELFLKIEERKLDNNEKEFRVEVSHPDDFLFLFGEGITRQKYQVLAEKWNVESEFEDFFKVLLSRIIKEADAGQSTQLKCVLSLDRTYCTFEFAKKQDFYIARMPMELTIVTGEALLQHLMNTIRHLRIMPKKFLVDGRELICVNDADFGDVLEKFKENITVDNLENWESKEAMEKYTATTFLAMARHYLSLTPPDIIQSAEKAWFGAVYAVKELYLTAGNIDIKSHNGLSTLAGKERNLEEKVQSLRATMEGLRMEDLVERREDENFLYR